MKKTMIFVNGDSLMVDDENNIYEVINVLLHDNFSQCDILIGNIETGDIFMIAPHKDSQYKLLTSIMLQNNTVLKEKYLSLLEVGNKLSSELEKIEDKKIGVGFHAKN